MYTVTRRVLGKGADGRTVLLFVPGTVLTDEEARRAGLLDAGPDELAPSPPLERMKLAQLRELCEVEGIDPKGANTRAEYIAAIEAARRAASDGQD
jgi:hypothetical protein